MTAQTELVCYKVVQVDIGDKKFHSNYDWEHTYEIGKTYREKRFKRAVSYDQQTLGRGFHSYMKLVRALRNADKLNSCSWACSDGKHIILKCVIPKGALYYEGCSGETALIGEYCSNKIKVVAWRTVYGKWHSKN